MNYFDLTNLQRQRLANQTYIDMAMRNVVEQQRSLERVRQEMGEEGVEISDDVSENMKVLNKYILSTIINLDKIKDFTSVSYISDEDKANSDDPGSIPDEITGLRFSSYNQVVDFSSRFVLNLEIILDNLKSIARTIKDIGPENFDFSQLEELFEKRKKLKSSFDKYTKFFDFSGGTIGGEAYRGSIITDSALIRQELTGRVDQQSITFNAYLVQIEFLVSEILRHIDTLEEISRSGLQEMSLKGKRESGVKGTEIIPGVLGAGFLRDKDMPKRYL